MRFGLGQLGLPPRDFWAATLRELVAACPQRSQPPGADDLRALMRAFPDHVDEDQSAHDRT